MFIRQSRGWRKVLPSDVLKAAYGNTAQISYGREPDGFVALQRKRRLVSMSLPVKCDVRRTVLLHQSALLDKATHNSDPMAVELFLCCVA
jgi:hypothetical protein